MKKLFQLLAMLMLAVTLSAGFTSCGNDDVEEPGVTLAPNSLQAITHDYNPGTVPGVCFIAVNIWSIDIYESNATFDLPLKPTACDWAYSNIKNGDTGTYSPNILFKNNESTDARYAVMCINSLTNTIYIPITQKGKPGGGSVIPTPGGGGEME